MMTRILFVCHGNICRSPMAEFVMKKAVADAGLSGEYEIASAATSAEEIGNDIYPPAKETLRRHGIPFERRRARQMTPDDYRHYDRIYVMDRNNLRRLERLVPDPDRKVRLLMSLVGEDRDVADPWYTGDFETAWRDINEAVEVLLNDIR